ncbi:MAG: S-methyl-5'-thioinosine phosphorylase [Candidatus Sulfobium sp.]|jgi:5'-methylthioadenosine phosphorylase
MPAFGIIAGSGLDNIPGMDIGPSERLSTPFGEPSDVYRAGKLAGKDVVLLSRHGPGHRIQPQRINYRANLWGFRELGVEKVISISAAGGIRSEIKPGAIMVPDQVIDMTSGRASTFYDAEDVIHVDLTQPYCPDLRGYVLRAAESSGVPVIKSGTYICVNGPRLETAAEIKTFSLWGADIVGMTGMPEAALARELEMCFAGISVITNFAAGIGSGKLTTAEVVETMQDSLDGLRLLLQAFFALTFFAPGCGCGRALEDAGM